MPKFATENIQGRQQVDPRTGGREVTQVVAQPVDTYVRPVESDLARLTEALSRFTPQVTEFIENQKKAQGEEDMARGQSAQLRGEAIPPEASPYFKFGYQTMFGQITGNELGQKMRLEASKHMDDPTFNPTAFAQKFIAENTQGANTPAILQAMNKQLAQDTQMIQQEFEKYQVKQLRDQEQQMVGKHLGTIFDQPWTSPEELRGRYDTAVENMKAGGIDLTRNDAGAIFGRMILARAYEGDPDIIKVARVKDKNGVSLEMANPELFTEIAKAQQQATHLFDKKQLEESQKANAQEAGGWEEKINKDPMGFGNPYEFFMSRWSKYGNVRDEATFLHWANKVASAQESAAKLQGHMWDVANNPHLTGLYWADDKFRKQFTEEKFVPIWQGVNEKDPNSVLEGIRRSASVMNQFQGSEDPYLKSFFDRSLMSLNIDPKTKVEKAPGQLVSAAQAYRYMTENGMGGTVAKLFDDKTALALRQFSELSQVMDTTAAYQKVLTAMRPENEKRSFNLEDRQRMSSDFQSFLKPWLGKNYDMNGRELEGKALFLADTLFKTTNMDPKEIREYVVESMKSRLVDVGDGKVWYAPMGNVSNLPNAEIFKRGANQIIADYKKANPGIGDITLMPFADGKTFFITNKNREAIEQVSIEDIRKGYEKIVYATGAAGGDIDAGAKVRNLLSSKGANVTNLELAQMSGSVERLLASGAISSKEFTQFQDMRSQVKKADEQRALDFMKTMQQNSQMFRSGKIGYGDDFRLDVANPGGKNLRTIDYAMDYSKRGDHGPALTMLSEGMMLSRYKDPNGKDFNIGFGFNMTAHGREGTYKALSAAGVAKEHLDAIWEGKMQITPDQAVRLYKHTAKTEFEPMARKAFGEGYDFLPPNAKAVLNDLAYATGNRVGDFKSTIELFRKGKFDEAGKGLKLTYLNKDGVRVEDTRRMSMYQRLLAGDNVWMQYLGEVQKRTPN